MAAVRGKNEDLRSRLWVGWGRTVVFKAFLLGTGETMTFDARANIVGLIHFESAQGAAHYKVWCSADSGASGTCRVASPPGCGFDAVREAELRQDVVDVAGHGGLSDDE